MFTSSLADCAKTAAAEELDLDLESKNFASPVSLDDMRELRVAHFQAAICSETVQDSVAALGVLYEEILLPTTQWYVGQN